MKKKTGKRWNVEEDILLRKTIQGQLTCRWCNVDVSATFVDVSAKLL